MDNAHCYVEKNTAFYDADIRVCDECGEDWTLRPKTQWSNGHCLLAFVKDIYGNKWVMCNRCFKHEGKKEPLTLVCYIKPKAEDTE